MADVDLFHKDRYHPKERWFGLMAILRPADHVRPRRNTKIWGAVLERMREKDFTEVPLQEGVSPAWPFDYNELAPYYEQAEQLYRVHGKAGVDPTEPSRARPYDSEPKPVEPFLEPLRAALKRQGCQPYDIPISWSEDKDDPSGDAQLFGLEAGDNDRLSLRENARVLRLHVNPSGREVKGVEAEVDGDTWLFRSDVVVLAAGAVNTPVILLRSANSHHPKGISNGSDQVGRNLMNLQLTSVCSWPAERNSGYGRSLGINDYYWGDKNVSFPLGHIQTAGGVLQDALFAESPLSLVSKADSRLRPGTAGFCSVAWWAMTEVMPDPTTRSGCTTTRSGSTTSTTTGKPTTVWFTAGSTPSRRSRTIR